MSVNTDMGWKELEMDLRETFLILERIELKTKGVINMRGNYYYNASKNKASYQLKVSFELLLHLWSHSHSHLKTQP